MMDPRNMRIQNVYVVTAEEITGLKDSTPEPALKNNALLITKGTKIRFIGILPEKYFRFIILSGPLAEQTIEILYVNLVGKIAPSNTQKFGGN